MFSAMIKVVKSKYDKILQKQSLYSKVILIETSEEVTASLTAAKEIIMDAGGGGIFAL